MNQYEMKQKAYQSTLKSRALQVLVYLIDRSNKEGTCFPAISTISRELHISVSTVKRALRELTESGVVKKESRFREKNNGQTSNLYTLCFSKEEVWERVEEKADGKEEKKREDDMAVYKSQPQEIVVEKTEIPDNVKPISFLILFLLCLPIRFLIHSIAAISIFVNDTLCWPGEEVNMIPP